MRAALVVLGKELKDGRRDKRAMMSAFLFPLFAPLFVYFLLTAIINLQSEAQAITIPVDGADYAPDLIQWLREQGVEIEPFHGDARQVVIDKDRELVMIIPPDYQEKLGKMETIAIEIVSDGSRTDSQPVVMRARSLVSEYNRQLASLRLMARGVAPEVAAATVPQDVDVASKEQRTARALNFIPLYIILAAFVSGMGIAVDSTAGERERKSLEPLLINPIERHYIIMGKWFAASLFAAVGMLLTTILCITAMLQVPLHEIGLNFHIKGYQILLMLIATLPLAFLATSMQLLLGMFAKSFKDAQSYIGFLTILPVVPSIYSIFNPLPVQDWMFAIPMLGQHLLLVEVLGARTVAPLNYLSSGLSCFLLGMGFVLITARLVRRESIIAG